MVRKSRFLKVSLGFFVLFLLAGAGLFFWVKKSLTDSLPVLDGQLALSGLQSKVSVERDSLGVPTIRSQSRRDAAQSLGFLHGQERFFQMDLMRRSASGRLSELFGAGTFEMDRAARLHQLEKTARTVVHNLKENERDVLQAYTTGVNQGLSQLRHVPFEYFILRMDPAPWVEEDSMLVVLSMFMTLQDYNGVAERNMGLAHDQLPEELFAFLFPQGTEWDAPLSGSPFELPSLPGPETVNFRFQTDSENRVDPIQDRSPGSNNWAVGSGKTAHGEAILANDMHLTIGVPNTWYRACLKWEENARPWTINGVTLPGFPAVVVGCNGMLAWGFTNSQADFVDVIRLQPVKGNAEAYLTPNGSQTIEYIEEEIAIKGEPSRSVRYPWTIWGPVIGSNSSGQKEVIRWTAHDAESLNMGFLKLETSQTLEEALENAHLTGIPAQNCTLVDNKGGIAWTLIGKIPKRVGFEGTIPTDWSDGIRRWDGFVEPDKVPQVVNPEQHCIWTANARVVDAEGLKIIGDGGYALGARSQQIRDDLLALDQIEEADMLKVQLDDRALFLVRWRDFLLKQLGMETQTRDPKVREAMVFIENWGGRASTDSVGFRLVRAFRLTVHQELSKHLFQSCYDQNPDFQAGRFHQMEGPIWEIVSRQPQHVLPLPYENWNTFFEDMFKQTLKQLPSEGKTLSDLTWGQRNMARIQHPISRAIPQLARFLDMPRQPLPGDSNMPRVQTPSFGASMRMVVSPGREESGIFHMPCGQSGHPLSPFYRAGHQDWVEGNATPFLPGTAQYVLLLVPQ